MSRMFRYCEHVQLAKKWTPLRNSEWVVYPGAGPTLSKTFARNRPISINATSNLRCESSRWLLTSSAVIDSGSSISLCAVERDNESKINRIDQNTIKT